MIGKSAILTAAVVGVSAGAAFAGRANQNCYEDIGCPWKVAAPIATYKTLSCQNLAHVRNRLYYENDYCFHSAAAKAAYGNEGCKYQVTALVPFSAVEHASLRRIRTAEAEKQCG